MIYIWVLLLTPSHWGDNRILPCVQAARTACEQGHVFCEACIGHPRSGRARGR
jgi:hypothetical protein